MKYYKNIIGILLLSGVLALSGCNISDGNKQEKAAEVIENNGYNNEPYEVVHNNEPEFTEKEKKNTKAFEEYAPLDSLGRCGVAFANICREIMPTEKREAIGQVKPSGWHTVKYDIVDGKYLYNRCHLIGYQLAGENANEKNLITGTRYLNMEGMLPFEDQVADYVQDTGNHVLYRVTPQYEGDNLVAEGVQMEGYSVEDQGEGISFNIFAYNVQPGIRIDYETGESEQTETGKNVQGNTGDANVSEDGQIQQATGNKTPKNRKAEKSNDMDEISGEGEAEKKEYVINTNTKKFHDPSCSSVKDTLAKNRKAVTESRDILVQQGYEPCKKCKP